MRRDWAWTMPEGRYELRYLPLFLSDLEDALYYVAKVIGNPSAASRLVDALEHKLLVYAENPFAAPLFRSTRERANPYRWFEVGNYLVFFVVLDDVIEVRRFLYGARDLTRFVP